VSCTTASVRAIAVPRHKLLPVRKQHPHTTARLPEHSSRLASQHHPSRPSNTPPGHPAETRTQHLSPSTSDRPPNKCPADSRPHPSPSRPARPSTPSTHPRESGSACPQSRRDTPGRSGWRRARPSRCGSGAVSASATCESGSSVWDGEGCGARRGSGRGGRRISSRARG